MIRASLDLNGQDERTYVFGYDGLDRLVSTAQYKDYTLENKYGEDMTYDRNGNITSLGRRNGSSSTETEYFTYDGNKRTDMVYDSNGNITCEDPDAYIPLSIEYNILNLPAYLNPEEGRAAYIYYLADGTKFRMVEDDTGDTRVSCGSFRFRVYTEDVIDLLDVVIPGGRAVPTANGWTMRYYTTDHLGSIRLVTDSSGSIKEQFDYLPFGELCDNSNLAVVNYNKTDYLYCGKESEEFYGIDWYDSFARWQTTYGIFSSPDPLMELFLGVSPYAYCLCNPVKFADKYGLTSYNVNGQIFDIDDDCDETIDVSKSEYKRIAKLFERDKRKYMILRQRYMDKHGYSTETGDLVLAASRVTAYTHAETVAHDSFDLAGSGLDWFKNYYPNISTSVKSHYVYEVQKWLHHNSNYKRIKNSIIYREYIPSALEKGTRSIRIVSATWSTLDVVASGEIKASDGLNTLVFLAGKIPYVGVAFSIGYPVIDFISLSITDQTIGEHLDYYLDSRYGTSSINLPWGNY